MSWWRKDESEAQGPAKPADPTEKTQTEPGKVAVQAAPPQAAIGGIPMIPQGVTITGNIDGTSNLRIDGTVRGDVKLMGRLEVGEGGLIEGNLHAEDVVVVGKVNGNIKSRNKLLLKSGSHVRGNLSCEGLIVEEGAWFSGRCSMGKDSQQSIDSAPAPSPIGRLTQVPAGARDRESVASRLHGQATTTNTISSIDSDERKIASEG